MLSFNERETGNVKKNGRGKPVLTQFIFLTQLIEIIEKSIRKRIFHSNHN